MGTLNTPDFERGKMDQELPLIRHAMRKADDETALTLARDLADTYIKTAHLKKPGSK
jgi:hypothetical protein